MTTHWPYRARWVAAGRPDAGRAARSYRVSRRTIYRWQRYGLSHRAADRAAIALGLHPISVWPDWQSVEAELLREAS